MKKEWADKWVAALRSGKYKQGKHVLYNPEDNTFCCLGVLCDISGAGSWDAIGRYDGEGAFLPASVMSLTGVVTGLVAGMQFTVLNDHDGASFLEIADFIEQAGHAA